jgi:hypothetical protein
VILQLFLVLHRVNADRPLRIFLGLRHTDMDVRQTGGDERISFTDLAKGSQISTHCTSFDDCYLSCAVFHSLDTAS